MADYDAITLEMAGAGGETAVNDSTCSKVQEQQDTLMGTLPEVFQPSELSSVKCAEASLKDLQDTGQVKSHCYSFNPSTQQLKLYWVSPKGHARTVHTVESVDHRGKHSGGCEAPVGGASGDAVMSSPDRHSLEKERQLKAEVASLKEKLHKLTTLKLNEDKTSASELEELTMRWRKAAQEVAQDISSCSHCMHECPVTVGRLLSLLRIPNSLLHYSEEEETFTD